MRPDAAGRGVVLLTVLVVVAIAALLGTTVMYLAEGERSGAALSIDRTQMRALAWSGVQGAMAELAEQRDALLSGAAPELTAEWTLYTDERGRRGLVRLIAIGSDGQTAISELGKIDLNTATEEMLAKVDGIGEDLAKKIVQERTRRPFESAEDLARVEGLTAEMLYGAPESDGDADEPSAGDDSDAGHGLIDALTVFAFDANIQAGLGDDGAPHRGKLRINLNTPWSDELAAAVADRFGPDAVRGVEDVFKSGASFKKDADIVGKLREMNAPPPSWGVFLDAFSTCPDPYLIGRIDLSSAPPEVLACVPGLDAESAAAIVSARSRLDEQSRLDAAWPASQAIVTPENYQKAADYLTTRSLVWRVRIEAGLIDPDADEGEPLEHRMMLDAVLDVTSERPRVAYLRDVTLLDAALAMERSLSAEDDEPAPEPQPLDPEPPEPASDSAASSPASSGSTEPRSPEAGRNPAPEEVAPPDANPADTGGSDPSGGSGGGARPPPSPPPGPSDRRRGRWTPGGKG